MKSESSEHFADMFAMFLGVLGENEDVIEVDNDSDIEKVFENVVHETLESGRGIG